MTTRWTAVGVVSMSDKQVAKAMMPWMFSVRGSAWRPFAKVRCEGGKCVWTEKSEPSRGRNSKRALASAA